MAFGELHYSSYNERDMHDMDDETRREVLGEALLNELKAIRECLEDLPQIKAKVNDIDGRLINVDSDVKAIHAPVRDTNEDLIGLQETVGSHDNALRLLKMRTA